MSAKHQALSILQNEHLTLKAVVQAFRHVSQDMAQGKLQPDFKMLWSTIYYIEEYPERLHHPKEDAVLFPRLRQRTPELDAVLDDLERQHRASPAKLDQIKTLLGRIEAGIPGALEAFADKVSIYADYHHKHMQQEETKVFPMAQDLLSDADWVIINDSFGLNQDPLAQGETGSSEWFRNFYSHLVSLVPQPWGLADRT